MTNNGTCSAGSILHQRVKNPRGQELGYVEELIIDLERGYITYAVLAHAPSSQEPVKYFAIPWNSFHTNPHSRCLVLDIEPETFKYAPSMMPERHAEPAVVQAR